MPGSPATCIRQINRRSASAVRHNAFTMLELIVVIVVIMILAGILLYSLRAITGGGREGQTRVLLENAAGLLAELDATARLGTANRPAQWWWKPASGNAVVITPNPADPDHESLDFWRRTNQDSSLRPLPIRAPGLVSEGSPERGDPNDPQNRPPHAAIANTAIAFSKLLSVPANRQKFQGISAQRQLKLYNKDDMSKTNLIDESKLPPVLLDAWNNPIIFVPAAGLEVGLSIDGKTQRRVITSSKVRRPPDDPQTPEYASDVDRPFFASAGPDGIFGAMPGPDGVLGTDDDVAGGDDNLYSFEQ
ncbi:prepilin-type N-terminal cleavage/methylation domain-containing protein [Fontivita pretiosa]|uniref:prepilin-type N-terminal cleavage/methylation domain-containing protein n=1 Tax=Fontivita pretiosa TaxID=2989684 RepID=UPI003D176199